MWPRPNELSSNAKLRLHSRMPTLPGASALKSPSFPSPRVERSLHRISLKAAEQRAAKAAALLQHLGESGKGLFSELSRRLACAFSFV